MPHADSREPGRRGRTACADLSTDGRGRGYAHRMAPTPTPDQAVHLARLAQEERIETIRKLAQTRQELATEREEADRERANLEARIKERAQLIETKDVSAYNAAMAAGWTPEELRKIGFPEPEKKRRVRRRVAARAKQRKTAPDATEGGASESAEAASTGQKNGSSGNT